MTANGALHHRVNIGKPINVAASISTPVESSFPVVGHLTMTTLAWLIRVPPLHDPPQLTRLGVGRAPCSRDQGRRGIGKRDCSLPTPDGAEERRGQWRRYAPSDATQGPQPSAATSAAPRVVFAKGGVARLPVFTLPTRIVVTSPIKIVVRFVFPHLPPWMLGGRLGMPLMGSRFGLLRRCQGRRRKGSDQDEGNKTFDHWGSPVCLPLTSA